MKCVINQPNYIPWRGYFHQIRKADIFVFYDDVQYDKHGWRNRNRIKSANGPMWLTIPVMKKGVIKNHSPIHRIQIDWSRDWSRKHWTTIEQSYVKAPFFDLYASILKDLYDRHYELLADFTIELTVRIAAALGITGTRFIRSSTLSAVGTKTDRLLCILQSLGVSHYISGPAAMSYLDEGKLANAGISTEYMVYDYPQYSQLYPPYEPQVSVLDLLFMQGPDAPNYIWPESDFQVTPA
jgi:hypothetical protein